MADNKVANTEEHEVKLSDFTIEAMGTDQIYNFGQGTIKEDEEAKAREKAEVEETEEVKEEVKAEDKKEKKEEKKEVKAESNKPSEEKSETSAQTEEEDGEISVKPFVKYFFEENGWEYNDEVLPTDTPEGMNELFNNIIETNVEEAIKRELGAEDSESIEYQLYKYRKAGGDPLKFVEQVIAHPDYTKIEISEGNEDGQKLVVRDFLKSTTKLPAEKIEAKIKRFEADGTLAEEAADAKPQLIDLEKERAQQLVQHQERKRDEEIQAAQRSVKEVETFIKSDFKFGGNKISEKEAAKFADFVLATDKRTGKTPLAQKIEKDGLEGRIKLLYAYFRDFDFKDIESSVRNDTKRELKKALNKTKDGGGTRVGGGETEPSVDGKMDYSQFRIIK